MRYHPVKEITADKGYLIKPSLFVKSLYIQNGKTAPNINNSQNINIDFHQVNKLFLLKFKKTTLTSALFSGYPLKALFN